MGGVKKAGVSRRKPAPGGRKKAQAKRAAKAAPPATRRTKPTAKKAKPAPAAKRATKKPAPRRSNATAPKQRTPARATPARPTARGASSTKARTSVRKPVKVPERNVVRIRDLDPYQKCGPGTSVERLIRVDEMVDRRLEAHLVFLDRHGWYCEHGRSCPAVGHARKHAR